MSRWFSVLTVLAVPVLGADEPGPLLEGWSYRTSARPLSEQYADPGNRLTDGETARAAVAIWQAGSITFELDLGGPCELAAVRVYQFRHNLNYKLDHLAVQARRGGEWVEIARQPGFFGPTASNDFVHTLDLGGTVTDQLRLVFAGCQVLSLSEIQLFGRRAAPAAGVGPYVGVPFRPGPPSAREEDLDGDGQPEVVLENEHVRLVFVPSQGGVCRSLRLKPDGPELVDSHETGYGLFRDQLWKPNYSFADRFYHHRLETRPDAATVELWATGAGGMMSFTTVHKRITLGAGGPVVAVHYTLTNEPSSQTDYEYGFWSHNWVGVAGAVNTYLYPTTRGVQRVVLDPKAGGKGGDFWYREPAQGWTACVTDAGDGLAMLVPYRYLNLFYSWYGTNSLAATHEWRLNLLTLKAGEKLEFDLTVVPFRGFTAPLPLLDGVVDGVFAGLETRPEGGDLTAAVRALQPWGFGAAHRVRWALARLPGREPVGPPDTDPLELGPGGLVNSERRWTDLAPGAYVVRLEVLRGETLLGAIERPVGIGGVSVAWRIEPEGEQVGRREETTTGEAYQISTAVETPHVPWARPFAGGRIKALVLMDDLNCREAVELAQRIDLDLDYTKFRTTFEKELLYQGDLSVLTLEAAQRRLQEKLATRYDLIVLAAFNWQFHFSPENRERILEQVREGAGLLLIQPDGFDPGTATELPVAGVAKEGEAARRMGSWFAWRPVGDHPLTAGLDWSRFPITRRHEYDTPPQGEVLATIGDDGAPLLTLGELGRGRVASLTYDTLTHAMSYRGYSGLTPILSYRGGWLRPEFARLPEGYQEWWYALLTRLTAWAAGRDTGVRLAAAEPLETTMGADATLEVVFESAREVPGAALEVHWLDAGEGGVAVDTLPVTLAGGRSVVSVSVTEKLTDGPATAALILRDPAGAALAWGFTTVTVGAPNRIAEWAVRPDTLLPAGGIWQDDTAIETGAYRADRPLEVTVTLAEPAASGTVYSLGVEDTRGRVLVHRGPEPFPAGQTTVTASIELPWLVDQGLTVTAAVGAAERSWDVARSRVVAYRPRVWNRFWYTSWDGNWLWRTEYLNDFNTRLIRDWGLDVSFWGITELSTGKVRDNAFWGINHSWLGLLSYLGQGVPDFMDRDYAAKARQYAQTKDKANLIRTPSLVDPAWREAVAKSLRERVQATLPAGGAYDYCMGDEMSLTSYTQFHDYDWSEASLADFRNWLRRRYDSLEALNRSWSTSYTNWEAVVPLTREEAREAPNPAPWAEFRMYMNDQLADFYRFVQETIRSVDPQAQCGLSGTQSPEAGNGMEWWRVSHAFSYFHSYNTSWSNEMRRSFQAHGGAAQSPYFSGYSAVDPGAENRMWWCLFHDTRGISAWKTGLFFWGDFSETPSGRDTKAHLDAFRSGIWRLLRGAERQHDGVAIYYSMPTVIAGALLGEENRINAHRDAWVKLIEDSGLQYEFVCPELVLDGWLRRGGFRVVILPYTIALSRAEAEELRAFVRAGGTVIASRPVGVRDELCRPQSPGLLEDVLGVKTAGEERPVEPVANLKEAYAGLEIGTELRLPVLCSNLTLDGATALAEAAGVPVLARAPGAVTVNLDLTHYEQERRFHSPTEARLRAVVLGLLADAGVKPPYAVSLASGRTPQVEVVRYRSGQVEYLCLLDAGGERDTATINLGAERYVYDVRAGAERGHTDTLTVPLEPLCARLYALSPTPPATPQVEVGPATRGGEIALTLRLSGAAPARQLIRLSLTDPTGRLRRELQQTIWLADGPVSTQVPLALNDPAGTWTLTATDVASGQQTRAEVVVE